MNFKIWLEVVELKKPFNKVTRKDFTRDKGTNVATKVIRYFWKTKIGNQVDLYLTPKQNGFEVIFKVNDVLDDYGSLLQGTKRDTEILPSVFYMVKEKADKLKAKYLTFHSHKGTGDTKIIRNLDIEQPKTKSLILMNNLLNKIENHQVTMIPPSKIRLEIDRKLGVKSEARPDIDKSIVDVIKKYIEVINSNGQIGNIIEDFYKPNIFNLPFPEVKELIGSLNDLNNAIKSNQESGYERNKNRRTIVYKKILERYFSAQWNIEVSGDYFYLTRL